MVVSVLPCITDATLPMKESTPYVLKMLFNIIREEDPEIGLNIANGNISVGKLRKLKIGCKYIVISCNKLLFKNIFTETIIANIVGNICKDIESPSFTPTIKTSKT